MWEPSQCSIDAELLTTLAVAFASFRAEDDELTPEQRRQLLDHLESVNSASKSIDAMSDWYTVVNRPAGRLEWQAALRLDGVLGGGVSARLTTPVDTWETSMGSWRLRWLSSLTLPV